LKGEPPAFLLADKLRGFLPANSMKEFMMIQIAVFAVLLSEFKVSINQIIETVAELFRDEWEWGNTDIAQFLELGRNLMQKKSFHQKTWKEMINETSGLKYNEVYSVIRVYEHTDTTEYLPALNGNKIYSALMQLGFTKAAEYVRDCYAREGITVIQSFHFTEEDWQTPAIEILCRG